MPALMSRSPQQAITVVTVGGLYVLVCTEDMAFHLVTLETQNTVTMVTVCGLCILMHKNMAHTTYVSAQHMRQPS